MKWIPSYHPSYSNPSLYIISFTLTSSIILLLKDIWPWIPEYSIYAKGPQVYPRTCKMSWLQYLDYNAIGSYINRTSSMQPQYWEEAPPGKNSSYDLTESICCPHNSLMQLYSSHNSKGNSHGSLRSLSHGFSETRNLPASDTSCWIPTYSFY